MMKAYTRYKLCKKICHICHKELRIHNKNIYVYKKKMKGSGIHEYHYFCSYKCMRIYERREELALQNQPINEQRDSDNS